jgi:hypothetical protein
MGMSMSNVLNALFICTNIYSKGQKSLHLISRVAMIILMDETETKLAYI